MPTYAVSVSFEFEAEDDGEADDIAQSVMSEIKSHHSVNGWSVAMIDVAPECLYDCPEDEDDDWAYEDEDLDDEL